MDLLGDSERKKESKYGVLENTQNKMSETTKQNSAVYLY